MVKLFAGIVRNVRTILLPLALLIAGCASHPPGNVSPPPIRDIQKAQISVKREFSLVGGGTSYIHDLYDLGSNIEYNADVSEPWPPSTEHFVFLHRITRESFEQMKFFDVYGRSLVPGQDLESKDPLKDFERVVESIDESLLDVILVKTAALNQGGTTVNPASLRTKSGVDLQRIKLRQLYDRRERVLYRVIELTDELCFGERAGAVSNPHPDLTGIRGDLIEPAFKDLAPEFKDRHRDYFYAELCGLYTTNELKWNARHIGSLPGFSPLTWERPPGRVVLYALLGGVRVFANEITVEAGKRYVGTYNPNKRTLVVEAVN